MFSFEILPSVSISIRSAEGLALLSKTTGNPIIFSSRRFESVLLEKLSLLLTELESSTNASSPSTDATHSDVIAELLEDILNALLAHASSSRVTVLEALGAHKSSSHIDLQTVSKALKHLQSLGRNDFCNNFFSPARNTAHKTALSMTASGGNVKSLLHFSGQGSPYLKELKKLHTSFPSIVGPLIASAAAALNRATADPEFSLSSASKHLINKNNSFGVDLDAWLDAKEDDATAFPSDAYLCVAPLSFPLICLTQLCHYAVLLHSTGSMSPQSSSSSSLSSSIDLTSLGVVGALGHSQGVVAAVIASSASSFNDLVQGVDTAVSFLFWQGLRMQEVFDTLPIAAKVPVQPNTAAAKAKASDASSSDTQADEPSPMLSVSGASADTLQQQIDIVTKTILAVEAGAAAERNLKASASGASSSSAPSDSVSSSSSSSPLVISLTNGNTSFVVSGRPSHLQALVASLDRLRAAPGVDQARVPHSKRKPTIRCSFLRVSAPYHTPLLSTAVRLAVGDSARIGVSLDRSRLRVPVFSTLDGRDLRNSSEGTSLVEELIRLQTTSPVDWPATLRAGASAVSSSSTSSSPSSKTSFGHKLLFDFGPGGQSSAAKLSARYLQGSGLAVVLANFGATIDGTRDEEEEEEQVEEEEKSDDDAKVIKKEALAAYLGGTDDLPIVDVRVVLTANQGVFNAAIAHCAPDWNETYRPRVVRRTDDEATLLDTAFSRLLGRPPVMVAGMTPCTSYYGIPLVSACQNAGYLAELACGGLPRPAIFRDRIAKLQKALLPGQGIALNMLYLNSRQWGFQFHLACQMAKEGVPIESICVAAGVPSLDTGIEIISAMKEAGLRFVSFKPGSVDAIRRTLEIAAAVSPFPVVLQWTGGRAGGHHSFEDVHAPMMSTYALIRRHKNVVLVVGSGLGSAECAKPWFSGEWSQRFSFAKMPFDGVLVASRMMVAKEAATSIEVKRLLVETQGVESESEWETSYDGIAGGILTVQSELGEPIHKVANRGMLFWRELDQRIFSVPRGEKRAAAVAREKDHIIARLNADYQKPFFGRTERGGGGVTESSLMTYAEVAARMVELMFVQPEKELITLERKHEDYTQWGRWVDETFQTRVFNFLKRAEATLRGTSSSSLSSPSDASLVIITSKEQLNPGHASRSASSSSSSSKVPRFDNPAMLVKYVFDALPLGKSLVLSAADYDLWLEDCRSGGKPVPFVPVVDGDIENWFKKDSLWYSEDLAAVIDRDAGRVAILQGPVAVRHSKIVDEPSGAILGGIHNGVCRMLTSEGTATTSVELVGGVVVSNSEERDTSSSNCVRDVIVNSSGQTESYVFTLSSNNSSSSLSSENDDNSKSKSDDKNEKSQRALNEICAFLSSPSSLVSSSSAWARTLLSSPNVVMMQKKQQGEADNEASWYWAPNPAKSALRLGENMALVVTISSSSTISTATASSTTSSPIISSLKLVEFSSPLSTVLDRSVAVSSALGSSSTQVSATFTEGGKILMKLHDQRPATPDAQAADAPLTMSITFRPSTSYAPLFLSHDDWQKEVKRYYSTLWFTGEKEQADIRVLNANTPLTANYTVTPNDVQLFSKAAGLSQKTLLAQQDKIVAPSSFAIVAVWRALIKCLFPQSISGDILTLVHLSNAFSYVSDSDNSPSNSANKQTTTIAETARSDIPLLSGESVSSQLIITEVMNTPSGKVVTAEGTLKRSGGDVLINSNSATAGRPWASVRSQFLFRGQHTDHENCFKCSPPDGQSFDVALPTQEAVAVLLSKSWFAPSANCIISPGDTLRFSVTFREEFGSVASSTLPVLTSARVSGKVTRIAQANGSSERGVVGEVNFAANRPSSSKTVISNEVIGYLNRTSSSKDDVVALPEGSGGGASVQSILPTPDVTTAPTDNVPYAIASRDLNPIHRNQAISRIAGLPATIVHGMWTSANGMRVLQSALDHELGHSTSSSSFESQRMIKSFSAQFIGMVLPGDQIVTQVVHSGMHRPTGRRILTVSSSAVRATTGEVVNVLTATAHVEQLPTAYVFTGQGSAAMGMGMDLYASSAVAKKVWDEADAHLSETYGFSILHIVRSNPTSLTVHFGGRKGSALRRNYMALETEAQDGSGPRPLLPSITEETDSFTFVHPEGLLFATQFTQPALVLTEKASFDDMNSLGLVPSRALFAGHSLGEYAALASAVPLLPVPILVGITFLRGMVMQGAVPRDSLGRSDFGMVACNPQRVGTFFTEDVMHTLVEAIAKHSKLLLEVVNYNVADRQYVVAGHLKALDILSQALSRARSDPIAAASDPAALLKAAFAATEARVVAAAKAGKPLQPERGEATIPLPGVDVPFHSRFLLGGVAGFRNVLRKQLTVDSFRRPALVDRMLGCYVPNLVALPFSLERYFAEEVVRRTDSPDLTQAVSSDANWAQATADRNAYARMLVIELLAYQFASPVQWIATQHFFFSGCVKSDLNQQQAIPTRAADSPALLHHILDGLGVSDNHGATRTQGIRRLVEIGPAMTLVGMAARTLETGLYGNDKSMKRQLLWYGRDADILYCTADGAGPTASDFATSTVGPAQVEKIKKSIDDKAATVTDAIIISSNKAQMPPKVSSTPPPPPVAAAPLAAAPVVAQPVVVQQKPVIASPPPSFSASSSKPIADEPVAAADVLSTLLAVKLSQPLSAIKPSATIKALVGGKSAVQNEILGELEKEFGNGIDGAAEMPLSELAAGLSKSGYKPLGKVSSALVTKMLGAKLPGGFSAASARTYLQSSRMLGPLRTEAVLVHALTMQPANRFSSEAEATAFLDDATESYGKHKGLDLTRSSMSGAGSSGGRGGGQLSPDLLAALLGGMGGGGGGGGDGGGSGAPASIPDAPVQAIEFIRSILAVKLSQPLSAIKPSATIKALVGGKSAVQNEILGELEKEFGNGIDGAAEMPLSELAAAVAQKGYKGLGKVGTALVNKLTGKFPGGFSLNDAKSYLSSARGLGPGRCDSVLLTGTVHQPAARLSSDSEVKAWLDKTTDIYGAEYGVDVTRSSSGGGGGGGGGGMASGALAGLLASLGSGGGGGGGGASAPNALLTSLQKKLNLLVSDQVTALQAFTGHDPHAPLRKLEAIALESSVSEAALSLWRAEHGSFGSATGSPDAYETGIKPIFDANKQRVYASSWAWGLQQAHALLHHVLLPYLFKKSSQSTLTNGLSTQPVGGEGVTISTQTALILSNRACPELISLVSSLDKLVRRAAVAESQSPWSIPNASQRRSLNTSSSSIDGDLSAWLRLSPIVTLPRPSSSSSRSSLPLSQPIYAASFTPKAPRIKVLPSGKMAYEESPREGVPTSRAYVVEMARDAISTYLAPVLSSAATAYPSAQKRTDAKDAIPFVHMRCIDPYDTGARVVDKVATAELFDALLSLTTDLSEDVPLSKSASARTMISNTSSSVSSSSSSSSSSSAPVSFAGKVALVTGCGPGSIGIEIVKALLTGGATVIATTSRFSHASSSFFRKAFEDYSAIGSKLYLLPFNQGSSQDVSALISHIYKDLGFDIDYLIPFAAVPEAGHEVGGLDGSSEIAHRLMLTNVLRMLGCVASAKQGKSITTRPALALLPLSPNHGVFGSDGLYAESKMGLEALQHKWASESWADYVSISCAVIGWTRGTGLMAQNNEVSEGVEALGCCRTFSQAEMALNLLALLHPRMVRLANQAPLWADFRGGFHAVPDLKQATQNIRKDLEKRVKMAKAIAADKLLDVGGGAGASRSSPSSTTTSVSVHARLVDFPSLPSPTRLEALSFDGQLHGLVDLDRTIVVTGYGEVCPWGNARTRWEMESSGEFSLEGAILLAWITGRIRYASPTTTPPHPSSSSSSPPSGPVCGWVDATTNEALRDTEIKSRFEKEMLLHAGIRVLEPGMFDGYDPKKKLFLHQVALDKDMAWIEVSSKEEAEEYRLQIGTEHVDVKQDDAADGGAWRVRIRRGAVLSIPKALRFDRWVAGQIPLGWDAAKFGVPSDLIGRMDPVVLYSLVAVSEALLCSGVTDPYEFFRYVHVSDVGNSCGGGMGGMTALRRIFRHRFQEVDIPSDTLQESFINTVPAWINMLLLSSSGPIKTPVGACATAAESIDIGVDTILAGKASVMIVGGVDDFCEEGSYEFAQMGATSNSEEEEKLGREPKEMCRPMTPSRAGFMEAQGAGMQIIMTARLAVAMGAPIYGVVALSSTATDKNGRSIPAPGQGVLTSARELSGSTNLSYPSSLGNSSSLSGLSSSSSPQSAASALSSPLLTVGYRKRRLAEELAGIVEWRSKETSMIATEAADVASEAASEHTSYSSNGASSSMTSSSTTLEIEQVGRNAVEQFTSARLAHIAREAALLEASARRRWCCDFWQRDPSVSPIRGALAVFGLSVDDITISYFHGTGTHANDFNESEVTHAQMAHLGRTEGQPVYVVAQKYLTGHPKGAAAAWMVNGSLQSINSGIVPGNKNAEDIDEELRGFHHLAYLSQPLRLGEGGVRACLVKSFGFGQAGGEILLVHPDYLLASLDKTTYAAYADRRAQRELVAQRHAQEVLGGRRKLVGVKSHPPYTKSQEHRVYLDPTARVQQDKITGEYSFLDSHLSIGSQSSPSSSSSSSSAAATSSPVWMNMLEQQLKEKNAASALALASTVRNAATSSLFGGDDGGSSSSHTSTNSHPPPLGVGVDVEPLSTFSTPNETFISRNFTRAEIAYCESAPNRVASFAGRWAAKEAIAKAITSAASATIGSSNFTLPGGGAPLIDIEVVATTVSVGGSASSTTTTSGAPQAKLMGSAASLANRAGVNGVKLTISHSGDYAVAVAVVF